jgi:phosphopantothenoylcysteine decarboxylase / phosphopantothenate---cysteine ligase
MHVIVGVTGGIAAYKVTSIIRLLAEAGHSVKVIPTENALRFIGATTLEALSHNSVDADLYTDVADVKHIALAQEADLVIVAPATAAFLARYANGIADDLLGNVLLATSAPVVIAPAMHTEMWQHPATVANLKTLESRGVRVIEPASGRLTGNDSGPGRLPEPEIIVEQAFQSIGRLDLVGKSFLVTAGGTHEKIDPVRFIGNRSSGKQGTAIAVAAQRRGASVTLIAANSNLPLPESIRTIRVETADELQAAVLENLHGTDCLVMAAAVSDYRADLPSDTKLKKSALGETFTLKLVANPDVLVAATTEIKLHHQKILSVGFAAETAQSAENLDDLAREKLASKGCDVIVANNVSNGMVFGTDSNAVTILTAKGSAFSASGTKHRVAEQLLDVISDMLG